MVIQMTSLQGSIGRDLRSAGWHGSRSGSGPARALPAALRGRCHARRFSGGAGWVCDRIAVWRAFSIGLKPTGSADPYGLRRTALGLVALLVEGELSMDLRPLLQEALRLQPIPCDADKVFRKFCILWAIACHLVERQRLAPRCGGGRRQRPQPRPHGGLAERQRSAEAGQDANWASVLDAYSRCARILPKDLPPQALRPDLYTEPAVQALHEALDRLPSGQDAAELAERLGRLQPIITRFFDDVMVNDPDEVIRSARQALMQRVAGLASGIAGPVPAGRLLSGRMGGEGQHRAGGLPG